MNGPSPEEIAMAAQTHRFATVTIGEEPSSSICIRCWLATMPGVLLAKLPGCEEYIHARLR